MDNFKIGKFLRDLRLEKHLSQRQLSEILHVTRQAISNWEMGKATPDSDILVELSKMYDVSINEILIGERITDKKNQYIDIEILECKEQNIEEKSIECENNEEQTIEEQLQVITLGLIDDNNHNKNKIHKLFITLFSIISIFIVIFLSYYFVTTYNSIKVYILSGKSDKLVIDNGIMIHTSNKTYIKIGEFIGDKNSIEKITLYYKDMKDKKHILYKSKEVETLIVEEYGYEEYFNRNFKSIKNNLYIDIEYEENSETIKLNLIEDFKNNDLFNSKPNINIEQKLMNDDLSKILASTKDDERPKESVKEDNNIQNSSLQLSYNNSSNNFNENINKEETSNSKNSNICESPSQAESENKNEEITNPSDEEIDNENNNDNIESDLDKNGNDLNDNNDNVCSINDIDFDELEELIKEQGVYDYFGYHVEYDDDGNYTHLHLSKANLSIEQIKGNVIKSWELNYEQKNIVNYVEFIDYVEIEKRKIILDEIQDDEEKTTEEMCCIIRKFMGSNL